MRLQWCFIGLCILALQNTSSGQSVLLEQLIAAYKEGGKIDSLLIEIYSDSTQIDWPLHFPAITSSFSTDSMLARFYYDLSNAVSSSKSTGDAMLLIEESLRRSKSLGDTSLLARGYNSKAYYLSYVGRHEEAIRLYFDALALIDPQRHRKIVAGILGNLATTFLRIGDVENAISYQWQSIRQERLVGNLRGEAVSMLNLGNAYLEKHSNDSALWSYRKTVELSRPQGWADLEAYSYGNMAAVYLDQGLYEKAIEYQSRGLKMEESLQDEVITIESHIVLGSAYAFLGDRRRFLQHTDRAMEIARKHDIRSRMIDIFEARAKACEALGDYKGALWALKKFNVLKDSLEGVEVKQLKLDLQEKYETEKKEAANRLLVLENREKEDKISRQRAYLAGAVLVSLIVLSLSFFIYRTQRRTQRLNRKITAQAAKLGELNRTKDRLFSIISHDLRGPIASFESITAIIKSYLQRRDLHKVDEIIAQVDKSARNLNLLLDNLLNWSMSQQNEISLNIRSQEVKPIIDEVVDIYREAADAKRITIKADVRGKVLADYHTFSAIIRNLLSNALKFSLEGSEIRISSRPADGWIQLIVEDKGSGISEDNMKKLFKVDKTKVRRGTAKERGTGLGLVLVKEFVSLNQGNIHVESEPGKGTTFRVSLPLAS